ncbi:MAG TPA: hypothetical protein VMT70_21670 [Vicinamibacteria bacterium]|nr:hypothetical protein [Vicinamibacteria bacterium]
MAVGGLLALTLTVTAPGHARLRLQAAREDAVVDLRGRVVCLDAEGGVQRCGGASSRFALEMTGGEVRPFRPGDPLAAMFADERVRERELVVRAREASSGELETIRVRSVRDGRLCDVDYFCEVCNVVAYAPGPCVCCGRPMALRETPLP